MTADVLVIGGGPAGSTAGHLLARAGRDVIVLEKEHFPRFHIGESLLPANMPLLERLGVRSRLEAAGAIPKLGARIVAASGSPGIRIRFADGFLASSECAFQVERATFDEVLLRSCAAAGARVLEGHRAVAATHAQSGWTVRVSAPDGHESEIRARYLVDASGRDTFLARARRTKQMVAGHRRVAVYAHFRGIPQATGEEAGDIVVAVRRDGWLWMIPLAGGVTSLGLVVQGDALREADCSAEHSFEHAIASTPAFVETTRAAERVSPIRVTSNYSYDCGSSCSDDAVAIGDALAFLDPVFSTGVWFAMGSGESVAETLDRCLRTPHRRTRLLDAWSREQKRKQHYYWRFIDSFYTPGFLDLLLQPPTAPLLRSLVPALTSVFAGLGPGTFRLRARLRLFECIQFLHRRFELVPRLRLGSVFDH